MTMTVCSECKFYVSELKEDQTVQKGKCRRFPPCLILAKGKIKHYFPIVSENDCCGEFKLGD